MDVSPHPSVTIPVGPIPVSIDAGLAGGIGYDGELSGGLLRDCPNQRLGANLTGTVAPYATLVGKVSAGIGISGLLEVGVRGKVTLIEIKLPFSLGVTIAYSDATQEVSLSGDTNLDIVLSAFGGEIVIFLDTFFSSIEKTITSWPGYTHTLNLFHQSFSRPIPFSVIMANLGT